MSDSKRLFIGIELNHIHKENLAETGKRLKMFTTDGSVTPKDNYHITLKFLGETKDNRIPVIEETMQEVARKSHLFLAYMADIGEFRKGNKSTLWMGIKDKEALTEIQSLLDESLEKLFYKRDESPYVPHITMIRNAELVEGSEDMELLNSKLSLPGLPILIDKLVLFESTRIDDELKYINIFETPLAVRRNEGHPETTLKSI